MEEEDQLPFLGFGSSPEVASREMTRGEDRVGREGTVVEGGGAALQGGVGWGGR
jgi:hypothetical protein